MFNVLCFTVFYLQGVACRGVFLPTGDLVVFSGIFWGAFLVLLVCAQAPIFISWDYYYGSAQGSLCCVGEGEALNSHSSPRYMLRHYCYQISKSKHVYVLVLRLFIIWWNSHAGESFYPLVVQWYSHEFLGWFLAFGFTVQTSPHTIPGLLL